MTPVTSPPADKAASASTPINPTLPPPYTIPMPRRASVVASAVVACANAGFCPLLDPQNMQRFTR
jgi:hypothetical protein